jgi:hypothetical protein
MELIPQIQTALSDHIQIIKYRKVSPFCEFPLLEESCLPEIWIMTLFLPTLIQYSVDAENRPEYKSWHLPLKGTTVKLMQLQSILDDFLEFLSEATASKSYFSICIISFLSTCSRKDSPVTSCTQISITKSAFQCLFLDTQCKREGTSRK